VTLRRIREEEVERREVGLKDGGHVVLACSDCGAGLMDFWITRPDEEEVWKVRATCPFCPPGKDGRPAMSYAKEVRGGYYPAGYGTPHPSDPDETVPSTTWEKFDVVGDTLVFTTIKAHADARPVKVRGA
jgi:hypothetical protein